MAKIAYGRPVADSILNELKESYSTYFPKANPCFFQVGNNPASNIYVANKVKLCEKLGMVPRIVKLGSKVSEEILCDELRKYSANPCMLQLPLPEGLNKQRCLDSIELDIDGLTTKNKAKLYTGQEAIVPCTAKAVLDIFNFYQYDVKGKVIMVAGKSDLVGKPLIYLLLAKGATVVSINSKTPIEKTIELLKTTDALITAIGIPKFFKPEYFTKDIQFIVDVGISKLEDGTISGDVDSEVIKTLSDNTYITPVPKGVGVITVANVLYNIIKSLRI